MKERTSKVLQILWAAENAQEKLNDIIEELKCDRDTEQEMWEIGRGPEDDAECWTFRPYTDLIEMLEDFVVTLNKPIVAASGIIEKVEQIMEEEICC